MKLIVWVKIEIDAAGVKVSDGSWRMLLDNGEKMPDGDAVTIIERQLQERSISISTTPSGGPPIVADELASRSLEESYNAHQLQGRPADGRPAPTTPRAKLFDDLQQIGIAPDQARELADVHGAARLESLLKWMASKSEPVGNPARLLLACLGNKRS